MVFLMRFLHSKVYQPPTSGTYHICAPFHLDLNMKTKKKLTGTIQCVLSLPMGGELPRVSLTL